ncbi:DoxX family protein [Candidatus Dependentiae bacterium]|nr:DoxX family protein [Candidatus Dependentiae bacterium]
MNKFLHYLLVPASPRFVQLSLLLMRVGIGILSIGHGYPKMIGGIDKWQMLGAAMSNVGISVMPVLWGFLAAITQTFGGVAFIIGIGTRIVSMLLTFTMIVAFLLHWNKGDSFSVYSFPLTLIVVFISFVIIGGGNISLDYYLTKKKEYYY